MPQFFRDQGVDRTLLQNLKEFGRSFGALEAGCFKKGPLPRPCCTILARALGMCYSLHYVLLHQLTNPLNVSETKYDNEDEDDGDEGDGQDLHGEVAADAQAAVDKSIWTPAASIHASTATHLTHASTLSLAKVLEIKGTSTTAEARRSRPREKPTKASAKPPTTPVNG